jgi:hypothetical protein
MRGGMMTRSVWLTPSALPERAWRIVAAEDFDGDGDPDILWKQADTGGMVLWTMNGTVRTSSTWLNPASVSDLGWQVVSASDWNNDGRADLLWHHRVSGGLAVWYMNGPNRTGTAWLTPTAVDPAWRVVGTGLVNGDSSRDLIWENRQTGDLVVWFMNGTRMSTLSYLTPSRIPDRDWRVVAIR